MKDIITPPFTEEQKELIIMTEKLASSRKICDVDDIDDDIKDIKEIILETIAKIENQKRTNFQRITASPEALTIFIEDIMMPCYGCNVESIKNCPHKKKSGARFCDRKECYKWLNQESKE